MELTPDTSELISKLNCSFRFIAQSATFKDSPQLGGPPIMDTSTAKHICEIVDNTTGKVYHRETGIAGCVEHELLVKALQGAITAPKPKTPAQEAEDELRRAATDAESLAKTKDDALQAALKKIAALERKMSRMSDKSALAAVGIEADE